MKRKLLTIIFTAFGTLSAWAQFATGNLAIYRYGDGTAMTGGNRVAVFVDEYTPSGSFVRTYTISRTAVGGNYGFEGLGLTASNGFENEGYPVLSKDGTTMSIIGYNPAQTGEFVIGTLNAAGTWTANTLVVDAIGTPRSAVVEGVSVYFNGFQNGVRYKTLGTSAASTRVSTGLDAPRVLNIADTYFSASNNGLKLFAPNALTSIPNSPLPTTSVTFATVPNVPGAAPLAKAHQVAAIKTANNRTLVYVIDDADGAPMLKKYRSNAAGTDWVSFGSIAIPANTRSITALYTSTTGVKLYLTSYGTVGGNDSKLYTYSDNFTVATEGSVASISGSLTELATAPANTTFRGVTMAPGTNVLPVTLTAFNANEKNGSIRLNWTTASEINASHYNIMRSSTASNFQKIDQVSAKGASNYSFVDEKPMPGTNYYQLEQIDFNGDKVYFGPVSAAIPVPKTDFDIVKYGDNIELYIYSVKAQNGKIALADVNGKIAYSQSAQLEKGYNKVTVPSGKLSKGLAIISLSTTDGRLAKKTVL